MFITPPPEPAQIIAGLQSQSGEFARGFRPGGTKDWLLVATLAGLGFIRVNGDRHVLRRGDLLLIAPQTPQDYGYLEDDSGWHNIWVHVRPRPHWAPWLLWPVQAKGVMVLQTADAFGPIEAELHSVIEAAAQAIRLRHDLAMNAFERVLIRCDPLNPLQTARQFDPRIAKAIGMIGENLAGPLNVDRLSRAVGLSRSRFSVLFGAQTAVSLQSYIEAQRLNRAAQLLNMTGWPIAQIAQDVGFADPYYFSTRFRRHFGKSPTSYRDATAKPPG